MLNESKINNIIKEAINDYVDHGEFTPIGTPGGFQHKNVDNRLAENSDKIKYVISALCDSLYSKMKYMKNACSFKTELNPMFIRQLPDCKEKQQMDITQKIIAKSLDLYNFLNSVKDQL